MAATIATTLAPLAPPVGADQLVPAAADPPPVIQIDAEDPVDAAITISQLRFPEPDTAVHAVLARSDDFADALAGSALTDDGPMLYTSSDRLLTRVRDELSRILPQGGLVYVLGGPGALSVDVEDAIAGAGLTVKRLAGVTRMETSAQIAREVIALYRPGPSWEYARLARAYGVPGNPTSAWADSVAFGAEAAREKIPVLLTPTDRLDDSVAEYLAEGEDRYPEFVVTILGGESAISTAVEEAVAEINWWYPRRHAGANRFETFDNFFRHERSPIIAFSAFAEQGWAHGLAAAGLAVDLDGSLVPVGPDYVPANLIHKLSGCGREQRPLVLVGDDAALTPTVRDQLTRLTRGDCTLQPPYRIEWLRDLPEEYTLVTSPTTGEVLRWDPCTPVHYVVNPDGAPEGGVDVVHEAFRRLSTATRMTYVFDGLTDENVTGPSRSSHQPERYGDRWAPVLVQWGQAEDNEILWVGYDDFGRPVGAGVNGVAQRGTSGRHIVSGLVMLNTAFHDSYDDLGYGLRNSLGVTVVHELSHVQGVGHVEGNIQVMSTGAGWELELRNYELHSWLRAGDIEALRISGMASGCLPAPAPG